MLPCTIHTHPSWLDWLTCISNYLMCGGTAIPAAFLAVIALSWTVLSGMIPAHRPRGRSSSSSDGLKLSGVKRCFIIAAMLNTKETYDSVKHQLEHSGVKDLFASSDKVTLSCDLKMLNIIFGLGSHTSSNPCVLCDWQIGTSWEAEGAPQRTFEGIAKNYEDWMQETNGDKKKLKNYKSCKCLPILQGSGLIAEKVAPASLHVMLGITLALYNGLKAKYPETDDWLSSINIAFQPMHGLQLAGNECRKMLKPTANGLSEVVQPYADLFIQFDKVVKSCFGNELIPDYKEHIETFAKMYTELGLSVRATKFHILCHHIIPFCELKGHGLGVLNESTLEARGSVSFWFFPSLEAICHKTSIFRYVWWKTSEGMFGLQFLSFVISTVCSIKSW